MDSQARTLKIAALLTAGGLAMFFLMRNRQESAPPMKVAQAQAEAPAAALPSTVPPPPLPMPSPSVLITLPGPEHHDPETAPSAGEIRPFDSKVPLDSMLERRPELIRILNKEREQLVDRVAQARQAGNDADVQRYETRIKRIDAQIAESTRRQEAREPAR